MKNSTYIAIILLLAASRFMLFTQVMAESEHSHDTDTILAAYAKMLSSNGIDPVQANFPLEAKRQIMSAMGKKNYAVIAGFFYRDLDKNSQYDPGEELSATLLGRPEINVEGISERAYFNCYWFDPVLPGKSCRIHYEHDGIEPVSTEFKPKAGLNIFHIRITPVKPLVYITSHSHFDPEWEMTYEQYLEIEIPHIQQRLDLLQVDPAQCFLNDEEIVTRPFVERVERKYVDMLRQGIIDGMIEPKGIITQSELTMPYGESLIRGITYGERMLSDLLGERIRPEVFSSIDQYGFGFQIPQILRKSGRDYFLVGEYLWRDEDSHRIPHSNPDVRKQSEFWLQGLDGSKVLVYREPYYHLPYFHPTWGRDFGPRYSPVLSHNSVLNFDGTDFCAPNVKLTAKLDSLNTANGQYNYIISPTTSFFRAIESCPEIPTFTSECFINYWSGVYESRVEGRIRNRRFENRILATESLSTIASLKGMRYPQSTLDEAWYLLLINQDHDPMMSPMGVPGLYEGAVLPRYETAESYLNASLTGTLNWLTTEITADQQPGTPVIVFNPFTSKRSVVVHANIPDRLSTVHVTDLHGKTVPSQVTDNSGLETIIAFSAEELPALGWKTYYVSETPGQDPRSSTAVSATGNLIENEHLRIELNDGIIQRITDKGSGTTVFQAESLAGVNEVLIWKDEGCISIVKPVDENEVADFINNPKAQITGRSTGAVNRKVTVLETGPVRAVLQIEYNLDWGFFVQRISLDAGTQVIRFAADVLWNSKDKISEFDGRRVRVAFNSAYKNARVFCDIPFGVIEWEQSETIRPVNSWLGIENSMSGAAFFHKGPQSVQVVDDIVYMTLFRSVLEPPREDAGCGWDHPSDEAAENGEHTFNYAVYIYPNDWKTAHVPGIAAAENTPVFVSLPYRKANMLSGEDSFISMEQNGLVVTAVKPTEYSNSGIIVRLYNPTNMPIRGRLATGFSHGGAELVNFREEMIKPLAGEGNEVALEVAPYEIITVRILHEPSP